MYVHIKAVAYVSFQKNMRHHVFSWR